MGAWIEIVVMERNRRLGKSHPTWVRGLKFSGVGDQEIYLSVAPHVGAWIEIRKSSQILASRLVAPHVGAWIEINHLPSLRNQVLSHPTWVRGLKLK